MQVLGDTQSFIPFALREHESVRWNDTFIGAISDGYSVASALAMGADLAYVGTRFIATEESEADDDYKQMLIDQLRRCCLHKLF